MTRPIRSRHGLTRCRACRAHIRSAATPSETVCPFCGENQLGIPRASARAKIVSAGRGGLLAASLLAFSVTGCSEPDPAVLPEQPIEQVQPPEPVPTPIAQPMDPVTPEPTPEPVVPELVPEPIAQRPRPQPRPDPGPAPIPPDDQIAVPAYGVAPPNDWAPEPAPDPRPMARYGLPPMRRDQGGAPNDGIDALLGE